jgi:hypothetical protein
MEAPLLPGFKLKPTFFGFKPKDRISLHENIFNLIWFGEGRWDWDTIYNMPIQIRALWTRKINQIIAMREAPPEPTNKSAKSAKLPNSARSVKST